MKLIDKDALVAEIEKVIDKPAPSHDQQCRFEDGYYCGLYKAESIIDSLEVKEVNVWKTVDNINPPQADRNKIYCVITKHPFVAKNKYLTATVVNHPQNEDLLHWNLLQWKCTEFPFSCYDMCEGDKYMQIV